MGTYADQAKHDTETSRTNGAPDARHLLNAAAQLLDNRVHATAQRKLSDIASRSPQARQLSAFKSMADNRPESERITQLQAVAHASSPARQSINGTGLPDTLKHGIESLSGMSMSDVKVHYNSDKPAQLQAFAYAQGTDIHVGPGQERHLPHEAWHVVQQRQGRVRATIQAKGVGINDDTDLEREADVMGARALTLGDSGSDEPLVQRASSGSSGRHAPVQRLAYYHGGGKAFVNSAIAGAHTSKASEGELGSTGMYYWKDDENAALVSAVIYNPSTDWAVMKIDIDPEVLKTHSGATRTLKFPSADVAPITLDGGKVQTVYGVHYRFIQNNLGTKLGEASKDESIEGDLAPKYAAMTGRQFLDSFDVVQAPTKANNYGYTTLRQVRANDRGLTNIIYGTATDGSRNTFSKTWEGKIADAGQQATIANMGLDKKQEVPAVLRGMNGQKGTVITET
ncbi:eCIS core domain-containing protein [Pandoraea anhela]|uniref:eCIS core domain-containing protein n=1 Tax=Pandoraea anhela TaxID=2508295 RepID=A0A5E4RAV1_9BURK|nr:DUF4157 domain-containing protein [Pandoraea anhela]VVD59169.1 hypothetical protein PAN31108_00014 [Pandoraea anhela]